MGKLRCGKIESRGKEKMENSIITLDFCLVVLGGGGGQHIPLKFVEYDPRFFLL